MIADRHGVIHRVGEEAETVKKGREAAARVGLALADAKEGGYLNGWYSYIDRRDIAKMVEALS